MHNLPANLPPLIGREADLVELRPLLVDDQSRLLTLTGPGGSGKTRLALALAEHAVGDLSDGIWFVDLATLAEPGLVPHAVASALGLREEPGLPLIETLIGTLRSRSLLLLLDNCEHLVEACATLCETLLRTCPALRILATSRERLGVTNEVLRQVAPLAVPEPDHLPEPSALAEYAGVRLFLERARAAHADLQLTPHTWQVIGQICRDWMAFRWPSSWPRRACACSARTRSWSASTTVSISWQVGGVPPRCAIRRCSRTLDWSQRC